MPGHPLAEPDRNVQPRAQTRCRGALSLHPSAPEPLLKCRPMWNSGPKWLIGHPEMKPEEESLATGLESVAEPRVEPQPALPLSLGQAWFAVAWHIQGLPADNRQGPRQIKTSASMLHPHKGTRIPSGLAEIPTNSLYNSQIVALSASMGLNRRASYVPTGVIYCRGA